MNKLFKTSLLATSVGIASLTAGQVFAAGFQLSEHSVSALGRANAGAAAHIDNAAALARNPAASLQFDSVEISVMGHYIDPNINVEGTNKSAVDPSTAFGATYISEYVKNTNPTSAADIAAATQAAKVEIGTYQQTGNLASFSDGAALTVAGTNKATATSLAANSTDASADDIAPNAFVPGIYVAIPVNDKLAFGVGLNSYFGLSSDYGKSYSGSEHANFTEVKTIYLTPSVAYKITDSISLGFGLNLIHGEGNLENNASQTFSDAVGVLNKTVPKGTTLLKMEGDGYGYGFQLGLLWEINDSSNIGFRYQSEVSLELDGDITYLPMASASNPTGKGKGALNVDLPSMIEIGYTGKITDNWAIMGTILRTGWSSFEKLEADIETDNVGKVVLKEENWKDANQYSIGTEYTLNEKVILRAGIAYDESPVEDKYRTLTIPDADRIWYTAGSTFKVAESGSIDLSFAYITGDKADVSEVSESSGAEITQFEGELSKVGAMIFSLGYNHKF